MKILHVVESLEVGGLENVVISLARTQVAHGDQVQIVCLWRIGPLGDVATHAGIEVRCCYKRAGIDVLALRRLRASVAAFRPDVIHTHNAMANYYAVAARAGLGGVPIINTRHGMGPNDLSGRGETLYRWSLRRTKFAVCVCQAAKDRFVNHAIIPAQKAKVVCNGIDLSRVHAMNAEAASSLRSDLGLPPGCLLFGSVGRLSAAKNHALMMAAFARLCRMGVPASLILVGDGALRGALEKSAEDLKISEHVRFLGSREDVPYILSGLGAFVLSSDTEGYSLALVEASAAGLPIIATDVGGNREIVSANVTGLLVPAADDVALASAMLALARDSEFRFALGRAAAIWAHEQGSLATMAEKYAALYVATDRAR